jgi:hypothetical protein
VKPYEGSQETETILYIVFPIRSITTRPQSILRSTTVILYTRISAVNTTRSKCVTWGCVYGSLGGGTGSEAFTAKNGGIADSRIASTAGEKTSHEHHFFDTLRWYSPVDCILVPLVDVCHRAHDVIGHGCDVIARMILMHAVIHVW